MAENKKVRRHKPSLAAALKAAGKAGVNVAGATLAPDGSISLQFGESAESDRANPWDDAIAALESKRRN